MSEKQVLLNAFFTAWKCGSLEPAKQTPFKTVTKLEFIVIFIELKDYSKWENS